ncbi:MAG: low temperature requirement protein A [Thiolinea sp.]
MSHDAQPIHHHIRRMSGRDPYEVHRAATPLELLFDLTFVVAFGLGASEFAHALAEGHYSVALTGFGFASFAICWAWINFSWFASAYDTDDWVFRLTTMLQMIGVVILAIGLPKMFKSLETGTMDNSIMVMGYVVMRIAMMFQCLRAAKQDPARRNACLAYVVTILVAQIGWVALMLASLPLSVGFFFVIPLMLVELAGPVIAERQCGGTPWHAHHIAERYGLFAIIALGEGVVGTVASLSAVIERQGWSLDAVLVCIAGMGLTFGMWWVYYMLPSAQILHAHRERSFVWGYSQMILITAIVATGAGLHVAAYFIEGQAHISSVATLLTTAIPVGIFLFGVYALYAYLLQSFDRFHIRQLVITAVVLVAAVLAALAGVDMAICLIIVMFAPVVTIIGYETLGYQHQTEALVANAVHSTEPTNVKA